MSKFQQTIVALIVATGVLGLVFCGSLLPRGARDTTALTNVHGIAYEQINQEFLVTQALAHLDVLLHEPVALKELRLSFQFHPQQIETLAVGVRDNSFWLSYQPVVFYDAAVANNQSTQTATVTIPLTDKLQDADRSIDVMFIANGETEASLQDETRDTTLWSISHIQAEVAYAWPNLPQARDYIRSVIVRERPL